MKSFLYFLPFFRPYKKQIFTWFLIYGAYFLTGIITPIAVKIYFDDILTPRRPLHYVWVFIGAYAVYAIGQHVLYFAGVRGTARIIENVLAQLRIAVYEKLHRLRMRFFDKTLSGQIVNQVTTDTRQLLTMVGSELVNVSLQTGMGFISFLILVLWNVKLALVVLTFLPIYAYLFYRFMPRVRNAAKKWRHSEDKMWGNWGEKLKGMALIQAFTRERREALKHHQYGHTVADRWYTMTMHGVKMNVLGAFTAEASKHTTAYVVGCYLVLKGELNLGEWISLSGLIAYILTPVQSVFNVLNNWQQSAVASERIQKILEEVEETRQDEKNRRVGKLQGEIHIDHVSFEYEKDRPVLHDIHFSISRGQNVAFVGHTGCGKTTLVNLLQGFYRPKSGRILIDQIPTTEMHPQDLRRNIGVVPQDLVLFSDTIRANIAYGKPHASDEEIWNVLRIAQIDDYVRSLPKGLETRVGGDDGITPSIGEKQRLSIARAVLIDPSIVILDEATSSLDSQDEEELQRAIRELLKGRTAIIIAHRLSTLKQCDLIVVMEGGRIVEKGHPAQLLSNPLSVYSRLHKAHYFGGTHA